MHPRVDDQQLIRYTVDANALPKAFFGRTIPLNNTGRYNISIMTQLTLSFLKMNFRPTARFAVRIQSVNSYGTNGSDSFFGQIAVDKNLSDIGPPTVTRTPQRDGLATFLGPIFHERFILVYPRGMFGFWTRTSQFWEALSLPLLAMTLAAYYLHVTIRQPSYWVLIFGTFLIIVSGLIQSNINTVMQKTPVPLKIRSMTDLVHMISSGRYQLYSTTYFIDTYLNPPDMDAAGGAGGHGPNRMNEQMKAAYARHPTILLNSVNFVKELTGILSDSNRDKLVLLGSSYLNFLSRKFCLTAYHTIEDSPSFMVGIYARTAFAKRHKLQMGENRASLLRAQYRRQSRHRECVQRRSNDVGSGTDPGNEPKIKFDHIHGLLSLFGALNGATLAFEILTHLVHHFQSSTELILRGMFAFF